MERLIGEGCDIKQYSPLTLAFVGDAVFDLLVREMLASSANAPVGSLNDQKVSMVCCKAQAEYAKTLLPVLTEEELAVYKRGRNSSQSPPRGAKASDYGSATGLECLMGYLYLTGSAGRITELFNMITGGKK